MAETAAPGPGTVLGLVVPNFVADTTQGQLNFLKWKEGKWCVVFSHQSGKSVLIISSQGPIADETLSIVT